MNHLHDICSGSGDFNSMTLDELRKQCQNFGQAWSLSWIEILLLVVSILVGFFWLLAARQRADAETPVVIGNTVEGVAYTGIGFFAGSSFGLFVAEVVPPLWLGLVFLFTALSSLAFVIFGGVTKGDGDAGGKVAATILGLLLATWVIVVAVLGIAVPRSGAAGSDYETYVNLVAFSLGLLGAIDGLAAALLRGPHWAAGWALVFVNSTWGFLGNILGLGVHLGSYLCWANDGSPEKYNRKAYSLYRNGATLKIESGNRFAFTEGWVMSCQSSGSLEVHEAIHVTQHFVLGPIYVVSHGIWDLVGTIFGAILGGAKGIGVGEGVTRMSYFDNPYEIMAYASNSGARDDTKDLVWGSPWSYIFMVLWIAAAIVIFIVLMAAWT